MKSRLTHIVAANLVGLAFAAGGILWWGTAQAQVLAMAAEPSAAANTTALLQQNASSEIRESVDPPAHLQREIVVYPPTEAPGTIIVDTPNTHLYFVLGDGRAMRYGVRGWSRWLYLVRHEDGRAQNRMAGLVSPGRHVAAPALSASVHGWRPGKPARRPRDLPHRVQCIAFTAPTNPQASAHAFRVVASGC